MTNPRGRYFISYRRTTQRTLEAVLVRDALRNRGNPTWRDLDDLKSSSTEDELIKTIQDENLAGAVMLIAPEVESSSMIRNAEAPRIFARHKLSDGFSIHPVLIGVSYGDADRILNHPAGFQDLGDWNLLKLEKNELTYADARSIAKKVLSHRLNAILVSEPNRLPSIELFSRRAPGVSDADIIHDFSSYFNGRQCDADTYNLAQEAMEDSASVLAHVYGSVDLTCQGLASLPMGILFGSIYSPLAEFNVTWMQGIAGQEKEAWSHSIKRSEVRAVARRSLTDPGSDDLVLAVGVSANIEPLVTTYLREAGLRPRASIYCEPETGPMAQGVPLSPADGISLVLEVVNAVRDAKDDLQLKRPTLHVFLACPLSMAVLIGQKLNTFSLVVLYEHRPDLECGYEEVHRFNPSGFSY